MYVYTERTSALEDQVYRVPSDVVASILLSLASMMVAAFLVLTSPGWCVMTSAGNRLSSDE